MGQSEVELPDILLQLDVFCDIYTLALYNVKEADLISLLVGSNRLVEGTFSGTFAFLSKHHQKLVFDTAGSICDQPVSFFDIIGIDRFDQADGADGDQIVGVPFKIIIFFYNMGNQSQIILNQYISCL